MNFSEAVLIKARRLLKGGRVKRDPAFDGIWWVESSAGTGTYRVQSDFDRVTRKLSWVTCTCPHGLNAGGTAHCYHVAAVLMLMRDEQTEEGVAPDVLLGGNPDFIGPRREGKS